MNYNFVLVLCFFAFVFCPINAENHVNISIYYESLCPDSISFINTQLFPAYVVLGFDNITLDLVPFGHASVDDFNGNLSFTCQHGPEECHGNKVHSCAISLAPVGKAIEFVHCSESFSAPADDGNLEVCANQTGIAWSAIEDCLASGRADQLLMENGKKTDAIKPNFIPTIVYNGKFNQDDQDMSQTHFKMLICQYLGFDSVRCRC